MCPIPHTSAYRPESKLFLSLPTGVPQHQQFTLEPALPVELIRTPIRGYHYSKGE